MKTYLLAAFLLAGTVGCSKKNDPATTNTAPDYTQLILGKWVSSSSAVVTTTGGQSTTNNTAYAYGDVSEVFTATNVTAYSKTAAIGTRPYSITGSTYTIDDGNGATRKFEIITLTSSSFVRKYTSTSGASTTVSTTTLLR